MLDGGTHVPGARRHEWPSELSADHQPLHPRLPLRTRNRYQAGVGRKELCERSGVWSARAADHDQTGAGRSALVFHWVVLRCCRCVFLVAHSFCDCQIPQRPLHLVQHQVCDVFAVLAAARLCQLHCGPGSGQAQHGHAQVWIKHGVDRAHGEALPHLASLECGVYSATSSPVFDFPPNLRTLIIECQYKHAISVSPVQREARSRPVSTAWNRHKCVEFTTAIMAAVGRCSALENFGFGVNNVYMVQASGAWFAPLALLPRLQSVTVRRELDDYYLPFTPLVVPLRKCEGLRKLIAGTGQCASVLRAFLAPPNDFTSFESFSFVGPVGLGLTINDAHVPGLLSVKNTLTTLTPQDWNVKSIDWITSFPRLHTLRVGDPTGSRGAQEVSWYGAPAIPQAPLQPPLAVDHVVSVLTQMPQITSLSLHFAALTTRSCGPSSVVCAA